MSPGLSKLHYVVLKDGRFADTSASDLAHSFNAYAADTSRPLVIHIHGGLVSKDAALDVAGILAPKYEQAGAFPLFLVWQSDILSVLQAKWADILARSVFKAAFKVLATFLQRKVSADSNVLEVGQVDFLVSAPMVVDFEDEMRPAEPAVEPYANLNSLLRFTTPNLSDEDQELLRRQVEATPTLLRARPKPPAPTIALTADQLDFMVSPPELAPFDIAGAIVGIATRVVERFASQRDHGFVCTIVEEIGRAIFFDDVGTEVWTAMKGFIPESFGPDADCGGSALVAQLGGLLPPGRSDGKQLPRIVIVGHSAGSIYCCQLLHNAAARFPELRFDVVFEAPAVRADEFGEALQKCRDQIRCFRMFTMHDALESRDHVLDPVVPALRKLYPRSLLYAISGILEDPTNPADTGDVAIVGMERYYRTGAPYRSLPDVAQVATFMNGVPSSAVWSLTTGAAPGLNSAAEHHGDFPLDGLVSHSGTLGSVEALLRDWV